METTLPRHSKVELAIVVCLLIGIAAMLLMNKDILKNSSVWQYTDQIKQAVLRGEIENVKRFLSEGIYDPDSTSEAGKTILSEAVEAGHREMVALLLDHQADPISMNKETGESALAIAVKKHREDIARLLLDHGADVNMTDATGDDILMAAIRSGLTELCRMIVPKSVNIDRRDSKGNTALMLASEKGNLPVVKLLLNQEVFLPATNPRGETALSLAVKGGYLDIVRALLGSGAEIRNELDIAASNYDKALVNYLLEKGAPISSDSVYRLIDKAKRLNDKKFLTYIQSYGISRSMFAR